MMLHIKQNRNKTKNKEKKKHKAKQNKQTKTKNLDFCHNIKNVVYSLRNNSIQDRNQLCSQRWVRLEKFPPKMAILVHHKQILVVSKSDKQKKVLRSFPFFPCLSVPFPPLFPFPFPFSSSTISPFLSKFPPNM